MKYYPFNTAYTQMRLLYGLELPPDEFESLGLIAWDKIGNKQYKWYKYQAEPTKNEYGEYYIDLPCNCDFIEAVTADYEDYQKTTPTTLAGNNQNGWIEGYVETRKYNTGFGYSSGKFIKYTREGNTLHLSDKFNMVNVLYKGVIVDDEGLPSLNERELDAIAVFCAQADYFKKGLIARDSNTIQMSQLLEQSWLKKCTQARVPDYLNQNEMDEVLNVGASWDRKRFGKSFKPIR
jgi:hypothetical protein